MLAQTQMGMMLANFFDVLFWIVVLGHLVGGAIEIFYNYFCTEDRGDEDLERGHAVGGAAVEQTSERRGDVT